MSSIIERVNSDSSLDKVWLPVVEQENAYSQILGGLYSSQSIPTFLGNIFGNVATPSQRGVLYDCNGVPLYCTIDISAVEGIDLGGWFLRLNPNYHDVNNVAITADSIADSYRYVAWWIPPKYYTSSFKQWLASNGVNKDIASASASASASVSNSACSSKSNMQSSGDSGDYGCSMQSSGDYGCSMQSSGDYGCHDKDKICEAFTYFSTIRDVPERFKSFVFGDLLSGCKSFINRTYGDNKFDSTSCDFHYPSQLKYSSLHCQVRHNSLVKFSEEEKSTRYGLQEILKAEIIMPESIEYSICCNSYHSMWMAISQHRIPWQLRKTCGNTFGNILHIGVQKRAKLPHLTVIPRGEGTIPTDISHSSSPRSQDLIKIGVIMNEGKFKSPSLAAAWERLRENLCEVVYLGDEHNFESKGVDSVDKIIYTIRRPCISESLIHTIPKHKLLESVEHVELCSNRSEFNKFFSLNGIPTPWFSDALYIKSCNAFDHRIEKFENREEIYQENIDSLGVYKVKVAGHHISINSEEIHEIDSSICMKIIETTNKIAKMTGLLFFGLDFVQRIGTNDIFVIDINHLPTYHELKDDLYLAILELFQVDSCCAVIENRVSLSYEPAISSRGSRWTLFPVGSTLVSPSAHVLPESRASDIVPSPPLKRPKTDHFEAFLAKCVSTVDKDIEHFYILEKENAYRKYIYSQYLRTNIPCFLADIIKGTPGANVNIIKNNFTVIPSSLGCWVMLPNPKYHPPHIELDFKKCFCFVAWWISPNFVSSASDLQARLVAIATSVPLVGDFSGGFSGSELKKAPVSADEPYLCTIRDATSARAMQSICDLYIGAENFFKPHRRVCRQNGGDGAVGTR